MSWGDLDIPAVIGTCEALADRIPDAATHVFPGTAHLPFMEDAEGFGTLVGSVLNQTAHRPKPRQ